jgi:hypothetical protein
MEHYTKRHTKVYTKEVKLHAEIPDENVRLYYNDGWNVLNILDVNDVIPQQTRNFLDVSRIQKGMHASHVLRYIHWRTEHIMYPYLNYRTLDEMSSEPIAAIRIRNVFVTKPNDTETATTISMLEKIDGKYFVSVYFNNEAIQRILNTKRDSRRYIFYELVSAHKKNEILSQCRGGLEEILVPATFFPNLVLPGYLTRDYILNESTKLFSYQVGDIHYMRKIENNVKSGRNVVSYKHSPTTKIADGLMLCGESFIPDTRVADTTLSLVYSGGNIISEVGLGKTIVILYHSLCQGTAERHKYDMFVEARNTCNYFYKRNHRRGMPCAKECVDGAFFCKTHCNSIFFDKRVLKYINLDQFNAENFIFNKRIRTNSTLIVCPNQLCDQWVKEYYDKFNPNKRVVMIVTKDQLSNITLGDMLFSDIVVVSYTLLTSPHYKSLLLNNANNKIALLRNFVEQRSGSLLESQCYNTLDLFYWNRVVLDEAHEIQNMKLSKQLQSVISDIKSDFRWNVTGTPFANGLEGFLTLMSYNTSLKPIQLDTMNISDLLRTGVSRELVRGCKELFRRNTKLSTASEYREQTISNSIHLLTFTDQERLLYDSYAQQERKYADFLIKLCCHCDLHDETRTLVRNCKSLDEIQHALLHHNRERLQMLQKDIKMLSEGLRTNEDERTLARKEKEYANTRSIYTFMNDVVKNMLSDDPCPVCLDTIPKHSLCVTKCGHKYCWNCISETQKSRHSLTQNTPAHFKCPTCNQLVSLQEVYLLSDTEHASPNSLNEIVMAVKSTKVGNIINFLKTDLQGDKIILFSQWEEMLHKVGDLLTQHNINVVYCCGTVYQKRNAVYRFKTDPQVKVILLSSRNAASGMNLTEANTVIMLEPIYGSSEYRNEIEGQALGRCARIGQTRPIAIHRFIIKDTIEEDILNGRDVRRLLL